MSSHTIRASVAVAAVFSGASFLTAQGPAAVLRELQPRPITLAAKAYDVIEILNQLEKQTGNRVIDRRSADAPRRVAIGFQDRAFWQALDELATKLDANVLPFAEDGVALVEGPRRAGPVAYAGL